MNRNKLIKTVAVVAWEIFAISMLIIYIPSVIDSPFSLSWLLLGFAPSAPLWFMAGKNIIEMWWDWANDR